MSRLAALLIVAAFACAVPAGASAADARPLEPAPAAPEARLVERPGAALPLDAAFVDSLGRSLPLAAAFDHRPVLLVPGYYRCPQLCGLLMHGLLEALHDGGLPRSDYRIVRVSVDPEDTPAGARERRDADLAYADFLDGARPQAHALDLRLLTGAPAALARLTQAAGWRYAAERHDDDPAARYAHPATVIVATPDGRISRYLSGVRFDPAEVRLALVEAAGGRIGGLSDRLALLCAHVDPRLGRHSAAVLGGLRAAGAATLLLLAALWWRQRRRETGAPP